MTERIEENNIKHTAKKCFIKNHDNFISQQTNHNTYKNDFGRVIYEHNTGL